MKKFIILIPVYNDWESLKKLLSEINESIALFNDINFECLIVNDASQIDLPELIKPNNLKSLEILNMKKNRDMPDAMLLELDIFFKIKSLII